MMEEDGRNPITLRQFANMVPKIQMVDLRGQYKRIKEEIDTAILHCIEDAAFINGPQVKKFAQELSAYTGSTHIIPCANGTDALQIAFMALALQPGDEVIVPAFTYVATAEVIALLGLTPVLTDVDPDTFNMTADHIEKAISPRTKAIVPVHLFGQSADMEPILELAAKHALYVIEDNAQAIGCTYTFNDGSVKYTGTMGHIGTNSFFPSKNLGCFGDGGAIMTDDDTLSDKMAMIANHGQQEKYYHDLIGINSRLDTIQAAILSVKLTYLDQYIASRQRAAQYYDEQLTAHPDMITPCRGKKSGHVFHQYTLKVHGNHRDGLKKYLAEKGIPTMIYYPVPLHFQKAFKALGYIEGEFPVTEYLCKQVLSLPMHTELSELDLAYITSNIKTYFN